MRKTAASRHCWQQGAELPRRGDGGMSAEMTNEPYSIYLVCCRDGTLYTGIATDVARRLAEHEGSSKGAKYLRGRGPLTLVFERRIGDRGLAQRIESRVKRLPRRDKADSHRLGSLIDAFLAESASQ
jgi:putative endonuclease